MFRRKPNKNNENIAQDIYGFIESTSKTIFSHELRREDNLIHQASQMQTAFSFITAVMFMLLPVVVDNRGVLSYAYIILVFSSITILMVLSLIFASLAQFRTKIDDFPHVSKFQQYVIENYSLFTSEAQRKKYEVDFWAIIQKSYFEKNERRAFWILLSFIFFYISLGLSLIWFIYTLTILF